jgi:alpha-mannosidase
MHDDHVLLENRTRRVLLDRILPSVHSTIGQLQVEAWNVGGGTGEPVPAETALPGLDPAAAAAAGVAYEPFTIGTPWGRAWSTTWFHFTGVVPSAPADDADDLEIVVDLGWNGTQAGAQAEGLVFRPDGTTIKALNPYNNWIPVEGQPGDPIDLFVEAAANPNFSPGPRPFQPSVQGDRATLSDDLVGELRRVDITIRHTELAELAADLEFLLDLQSALDLGEPRRWKILRALESALDALDLSDLVGTATAARAELAEVLAKPAVPSAHTVSVIGHSHIDSAWLWPVRETVRKVARTTSNVLDLMEREPELQYAMSSAQQYAWIKETRPQLWVRIVDSVKQGRFHPIGGMWVESDANLVGSEAMVRQFTFGQRFFREEFGITNREAWLPDTFGYSAALPQICSLAGIRWFFTQKISWNKTNRFPHHTFQWEGIDGTRIYTHFPPADTLQGVLSAGQLTYSVKNFSEKAVSDHSFLPFGWGDGGGGPTREMMQRAKRARDLEGAPKLVIRKPADFFAEAEQQYPDPPVWKGELYLELHRATSITQADVKRGNRTSERLLHEAEAWATAAAVRGLIDYPYEELEAQWRMVLLHQFHDMLPGTSIAWVHQESIQRYREIAAALGLIIERSLAALAGTGDTQLVANASPYPRRGIEAYALQAAPSGPARSGVVTTDGDGWLIANDRVSVRIGADGTIVSAVGPSGREVLPPGTRANLLQLHPDLPAEWDAWDVDKYYRNTVVDLDSVDEIGPVTLDDGRAGLRVVRSFGHGSSVVQEIALAADGLRVDISTEIDWHEQEHLLKVAFPVDVHADTAAYETQFGHVVRPTHDNTTWEAARFEIVAHRWVHVGERGWGAAVVNDSTYGHDVTRHEHPNGGTYTTVRLSLVRGPLFPDPQADQGRHLARFALVLDADISDAVREGYALGTPERSVSGDGPVDPIAVVDGPVVLETIKLADDRSGDLVLRLYEPNGDRASATLRVDVPVSGVREVDLLEEDRDGTALLGAAGDKVDLCLRPFEIVTLRLTRAGVLRQAQGSQG